MKKQKVLKSVLLIMFITLTSSLIKVSATSNLDEEMINREHKILSNINEAIELNNENNTVIQSIISEMIFINNEKINDDSIIDTVFNILIEIDDIDIFESESLRDYLERVHTYETQEKLLIMSRMNNLYNNI